MLTDQETNKIFISGLLQKKYMKLYEDLVHIFEKHQQVYERLPYTKDIWVRDFMPVQIRNNKFIEYRYDPDYLQTKKWRKDKSYPDIICEKIGLNTTKTDLILDGGNVIRGENHAILTDKAILENKDHYSRDQLEDELKKLFEVEHIVWIPWDKEEPYGHADGMVRFIDDHNVLVNHYYRDYNNEFQDQLFGSLEKAGLNYHKLKIDVAKPDDRNWAYINYLRTKDIIILPVLGIEEDQLILDQMKSLFPDYAANDKIEQVDACELIKEGGVLNCITWTIKSV
jgi:agmatine deiminase